MRVTVAVVLDPSEQIVGQPVSAEVILHPGAIADLVTLARTEAANVYLPAPWRENTAAMVAARILAGGLTVRLATVLDSAEIRTDPLRHRASSEARA